MTNLYSSIWCYFLFFVLLLIVLLNRPISSSINSNDSGDKINEIITNTKLIWFTVATNETEGYERFLRSARNYGHEVKVLGMGQEWKGGDIKRFPGGGQKILLLKEALKTQMKETTKQNIVVMFTDSYDVIINGESSKILDRFRKIGSKILFSAEKYCWPDASLAVNYPIVKSGQRYLNSGMFMGYLEDIYDLINYKKIEDSDDDQLYYTNIFLDEKLRKTFDIKLDHVSSLFQNLNGVSDDIDISLSDPDNDNYPSVRNLAYSTIPLVVHGNGASKVALNHLGRYIGKVWRTDLGCIECKALTPTYSEMKSDDLLPIITVALFIERPTPFLAGFFGNITALAYPKTKIHLFLHNKEIYHEEVVNDFVNKFGDKYKSKMIIGSKENVDEREARNKAIIFSCDTKSEFLFVVDSDVRFISKSVITKMMDTKKPIIAPMVNRPAKLYANFWGALGVDGFYSRSEDYTDIVEHKTEGIWNVPYISSTYLIRSDRLKVMKDDKPYSADEAYDPDMSFTRYCVDKGYFMFVDNMEAYGYLIFSDNYDIKLKHPDFYQLIDNQADWEKIYIHENYSQVLENAETAINQPCPDVYWFPVFSEKFCRHLIDIMENFGKWSSGTNQDERLTGGYENVPTRDIHMNQVGFEPHWLEILDKYIRPVQEKVYIGHFNGKPRATMNFVVRYRPDEQPSLRPHHDASTYTINAALNEHGVDYEGGGARFIRYNCSVIKSRVGWALMHPGRLTHFHEGLKTTSGTRYIMISFVDP